MSVVLNRPYEFIPPTRTPWWPTLIQRLRLIDWHLRRNEGVVDYEIRYADRLKSSLDAKHGILLAPNHCRYADPIALGWLGRATGTHLYAMASWHLYNKSRFDSFALQRMGGFSIYREGNDRKSLEMAVEILASAERPLIVFPEGTTNRTNDVLKPLLDGVPFLARTAARRREKNQSGKVVIHPVGMKYLCVGDVTPWAEQQLDRLESRIGWRRPIGMKVVDRTVRLAEGMLALKEVEHLGSSNSGDLRQRRNALMSTVLAKLEQKYDLASPEGELAVRERVRQIRTKIASEFFASDWRSDTVQRRVPEFETDIARANLAQELLSFPDSYLSPGEITDTRIVETIQRIQEAVFGKAADTIPLKVVIEVDRAIDVPHQKAPRKQPDPVMTELRESLERMIDRLSGEARPYDD